MKLHLSVVLLGLALGASTTQGGEKDAQALASDLRRMMLQYEQQVTAKVNREKKFYIEQQKLLRDLWLPGEIPDGKTNNDATLNGKVRQSVPFFAVKIEAFREAHELAERLAINPSAVATTGDLFKYLHEGVRDDLATIAGAQRRQQILRAELGPGLAEIDLQDARRKSIRESVQQLESSPSATERLRQVFEIGQAAAKQLKKDPEAEAEASK